MKDETAKNIYGLSVLLLEELEKTEGTSMFKQKFKFHAKALISEIEKFDRGIYSHAGGEEMFEFVDELRDKLGLIDDFEPYQEIKNEKIQ